MDGRLTRVAGSSPHIARTAVSVLTDRSRCSAASGLQGPPPAAVCTAQGAVRVGPDGNLRWFRLLLVVRHAVGAGRAELRQLNGLTLGEHLGDHRGGEQNWRDNGFGADDLIAHDYPS